MIDTHVHFWRYSAQAYPWIGERDLALKQDRLPADLLGAIPEDITGVVAIQARPVSAENTFLLDLAARYPRVLAVIGWFDFDAAPEPQLMHARRCAALKGFRHLIQDEPDPSRYLLEHAGLQDGMRAIQRDGYVYEILTRQVDLPAVLAFCQRHDQAQLVIDHLSKPRFGNAADFDDWRRNMQALSRLDHVAVKISGLVTEAGPQATAADLQPYVDQVITLFGPARAIWGSDWPVSSASQDYAALLAHWESHTRHWSRDEKQAVQTGTAQRIYQL